jgi:hypothetical protein
MTARPIIGERTTVMEYPTDIVNDYGWGRIHRGHNLTLDMLQRDMVEHHGYPAEGQSMRIEEVHMRYVPRVKWCERLDGWPCDDEGEWHSHWTAVRPGQDTAFTLVHWESVRQPA